MNNEELLKSLPQEVQDAISSNDYDTAFERTQDGKQENAVIRLFLSNQPYWNNVKDAEPALNHIFRELGFNESDNPFITFLNRMGKKISLTNSDIVTLNNLYANDVVEANDIMGSNYEKSDSLYYNPNFYGIPADKQEYYAQVYNWLGFAANTKKLNLTAMNHDLDLPDEFRTALKSLSEKSSPQDFRDTFLYVNTSPKGKLNDVKYIKKALTDGSTKRWNYSGQRDTDETRRILQDIRNLSKSERDALIKALGELK